MTGSGAHPSSFWTSSVSAGVQILRIKQLKLSSSLWGSMTSQVLSIRQRPCEHHDLNLIPLKQDGGGWTPSLFVHFLLALANWMPLDVASSLYLSSLQIRSANKEAPCFRLCRVSASKPKSHPGHFNAHFGHVDQKYRIHTSIWVGYKDGRSSTGSTESVTIDLLRSKSQCVISAYSCRQMRSARSSHGFIYLLGYAFMCMNNSRTPGVSSIWPGIAVDAGLTSL